MGSRSIHANPAQRKANSVTTLNTRGEFRHRATKNAVDSWKQNTCPIMGPICNKIADMVWFDDVPLCDIAKACGMNPSTLYRIISGQVSPNLSSVITLMEYLGFEIKKRSEP